MTTLTTPDSHFFARAFATLILLLLSSQWSSVQAQKFRRADVPIAGEYIIVLAEPSENTDVERANALSDADALVRAWFGTPRFKWRHSLLGMSAKLTETNAIAVSADPRVAYVEENGTLSAAATQYSAPWGLDRVDQRSLPLSTTYDYNVDGSGVHVYVLDSGIRISHQEFTGEGRIGAGIDKCTVQDHDRNACDYHPAGAPNALTVGGTTSSDARNLSPPSNYGSCLDVFAPGANIISASNVSDTATITASGTSFAAPHVAGIAALYLSQVGMVPTSTVADFIILNATTGVVTNAGSGSPNRLLYSRWTKHWFYIGTENCYDLFGQSCYSHVWTPACPARPVKLKACSTTGATCWSIVNSTYVEEYQCSGTN